MLTSILQDLHKTAVLPPIEFQLTDFLDINPESDCTIHFNWDDYQILIKDQIKALAMFRCQEMIRERSGLEHVRDLDYIPSDSF
jgi:hypothetical protein